MLLQKVISGGQTGVDQLGIKMGRLAGFETGGTAPNGWRTENGPCYALRKYGLVESHSRAYPPRTEQNVKDADATVLFGKVDEGGTKLTINLLVKHKRPYIANPDAAALLQFLNTNSVKVLNVAGNRGSRLTSEDRKRIGSTMLLAFQTIKQLQ